MPSALARAVSADARTLCDGLAARGFAVAESFLAPADAATLRAEGERRRAAGAFRPARVGRAPFARRHAETRGDEICWIDAERASPPERALLARLAALRVALARGLCLALPEIEAHYARYAAGARYARHVDRFRDDDARAISLVLYLNDAWGEGDGGALALFTAPDDAEPALRVAPRGGTLVAMRSDTVGHAVEPARRERWSIAGWLRGRA